LIQTIDLFYDVADRSRVWIDVDACEALLKQAENQQQDALAIPLLEEAPGYLERGEYLEGEDGAWCYGLRHRPEEMLRQCRLWLAEGYESQGKFWQAGEQYRALRQLFLPDEDAL
jgi:two-component SAPR family response regulator